MVKAPALAVSLLLAVGLAGCSRGWWGESPKAPGVIDLSSTKAGCPSLDRIVKGSEAESQTAFECFASQLGDAWTQVKGARPDALSDDELATLIRKGALVLPGDRERAIRGIIASKKLLGFPGDLTRGKLDRWVRLVRLHRGAIRTLYLKAGSSHPEFGYDDLASAATFLISAFREMDWTFDSQTIGTQITALAETLKSDSIGLADAIPPAARVAMNFLYAICPSVSSSEVWSAAEIATCLDSTTAYFQPAHLWFEFILNPIEDMTADQASQLRTSLAHLTILARDWFDKPELQSRFIETRLWVELARTLGAEPPAKFVEGLKLIKRFNEKSDITGPYPRIHPTALSRAWEVVQEVHGHVISGLPFFLDALATHQCENPEARRWTDCVPTDLAGIRSKAMFIDLALRVQNVQHGRKAVPFNGDQFAKTMLFYSFAGQIMDVFDENREGVISANLGDDRDEVVKLLTLGLQTYEVFHRFIVNIEHRLHGEALETGPSTSDEIRNFDTLGLARLITMTSELLVQRTEHDRNSLLDLVTSLVKKFTSVFPQSPLYLDRQSVTAALTLVDALGHYRDAYLETLGIPQDSALISRPAVIARLPDLYREYFPVSFGSCSDFGFERSCGIAVDNILPHPDPGETVISSDSMDVFTILATAIEGVLLTCDVDGNGALSWQFLAGNDELDCGFTKAKDVVKRLIDSKILQTSSTDRVGIKFLIESVNSVFITRPIGKIAMVRGTLDTSWANLFLVPFYNNATIGSMYGLLSDIGNHDRVEAQEAIDEPLVRQEKIMAKKADKASSISMSDLHDKFRTLSEGEIILDVRTPEEFREAHVPGSRNIPHDQVAQAAPELLRYKTIYIHCKAGGRAMQATAALLGAGLTNLVCVEGGGMPDWISAGYETEK